MKAIDAALEHLTMAATALERHSKPSLKDVQEAESHAKSAHKKLKAAREFIEEGIYEVADEPPQGTPLPLEGSR